MNDHNPVALVTRVGPHDRSGRKVTVLYCTWCCSFHPLRCFHRDRTTRRGYRYTCKMHRHDTRPPDRRDRKVPPKVCTCGRTEPRRPHADDCPRRRPRKVRDPNPSRS